MRKVLIIEDEEPVRANLLELLEAEEFDVVGAENGRVGVEAARQHLPHLILCDIMMPELDGYGVLNELRQDPVTATIPFIFLTAKAAKSDLRAGMDLGADDYLTKPFTRDEVLKAVSARLEKQAAVSKKIQARLDELRSNITLSLPHELRTPLTGVLGFSQVLAEEYAAMQPDQIRDIAQAIHRSAERLHRLISNFVMYTELEVATKDAEFAQVMRGYGGSAAGSAIAEMALRWAQRAQREADLSLEVADGIVPMPPHHLQKTVEELLDNAFKFSKAGTPVRVQGKPNGRGFALSVTDFGRGMTPEQIASVGAYMQFERKHYEQQGQGLGLTIAKRLTELYSGEFIIESVPGQQTTVRVVWPG